MTTQVMPPSSRGAHATRSSERSAGHASRLIAPIARLLFVAIFLASAPMHFSSEGVAYASGAEVPLAHILVPISGILMLLGGLSVLLGFYTRIGALLLLLFLVPVTFGMHAFWSVPDPQMAQVQYVMFMKNLSIIGGALMLVYFGAGPISVDERIHRRD